MAMWPDEFGALGARQNLYICPSMGEAMSEGTRCRHTWAHYSPGQGQDYRLVHRDGDSHETEFRLTERQLVTATRCLSGMHPAEACEWVLAEMRACVAKPARVYA